MKWALLFLILCRRASAQRLRAQRAEAPGNATNAAVRASGGEATALEDGGPLFPSESSTTPRELQSTTYDAVIIGAGWAGLGAAKMLQSRNILVLEARDYIGGRSRTVAFSDGVTTELGSGWIHSATTKNPIYNAAKASGVPIVSSPFEGGYWSNVYGPNTPHRVPDSEIDQVIANMESGFQTFLASYGDDDDSDIPLRQAADEYVTKKGIQGDQELAFETAIDSEISQEYGASLEDLSRWWWDSDGALEGGDAVLGGKGYTGVVNSYAAPFKSKIQTKAKVTKIDWTNAVVTVRYMQNGIAKTVKARNVIVTVPLGVLKRNAIQFVPALPAAKKTAIAKLGSALLNKCVMEWDASADLPWPSNLGWLEKIAPLGQQGKWTEFFNLERDLNKKVLVAWTAGREAQRVEKLTNAQIKTEVLASLEAMYGVGSVPAPKDWIITRWMADEFAGGSYSYYAVGSSPKNRKDLAAPVGNRVYWAGEATNTVYMSTTQGALQTGLAVGQQVLNKFRRNQRSLESASSELEGGRTDAERLPT